MRLVRQDELQRCNDVRRSAQQDLALGERFGDQPEFVIFEVAQSAVNELGAPRRGMRGEVILLDEQHLESASRGVARDTRSVDSTAGDDEVVKGNFGGGHAGRVARSSADSTAAYRAGSALPSRLKSNRALMEPGRPPYEHTARDR